MHYKNITHVFKNVTLVIQS